MVKEEQQGTYNNVSKDVRIFSQGFFSVKVVACHDIVEKSKRTVKEIGRSRKNVRALGLNLQKKVGSEQVENIEGRQYFTSGTVISNVSSAFSNFP